VWQYAKATQNRSLLSVEVHLSVTRVMEKHQKPMQAVLDRPHEAALARPSPFPKSSVKNIGPIPPSHSSERYSRDNYVTCLSEGKKKASQRTAGDVWLHFGR